MRLAVQREGPVAEVEDLRLGALGELEGQLELGGAGVEVAGAEVESFQVLEEVFCQLFSAFTG